MPSAARNDASGTRQPTPSFADVVNPKPASAKKKPKSSADIKMERSDSQIAFQYGESSLDTERAIREDLFKVMDSIDANLKQDVMSLKVLPSRKVIAQLRNPTCKSSWMCLDWSDLAAGAKVAAPRLLPKAVVHRVPHFITTEELIASSGAKEAIKTLKLPESDPGIGRTGAVILTFHTWDQATSFISQKKLLVLGAALPITAYKARVRAVQCFKCWSFRHIQIKCPPSMRSVCGPAQDRHMLGCRG
jgi:hypothetical protein